MGRVEKRVAGAVETRAKKPFVIGGVVVALVLLWVVTRKESEAVQVAKPQKSVPPPKEASAAPRPVVRAPVPSSALPERARTRQAGPLIAAVIEAFRDGLDSPRLKLETTTERSLFIAWRERVLTDLGDVGGLSVSRRGTDDEGTVFCALYDAIFRPLGFVHLRNRENAWRIVGLEPFDEGASAPIAISPGPTPDYPLDQPPPIIVGTLLLEETASGAPTPRLVKLRNCSSSFVSLEWIRLVRGPVGSARAYDFPRGSVIAPGGTIAVECTGRAAELGFVADSPRRVQDKSDEIHVEWINQDGLIHVLDTVTVESVPERSLILRRNCPIY